MSEDVYLDQINIVVRDIEKSAAFYARLGLKVGDEVHPSGSRTIERPQPRALTWASTAQHSPLNGIRGGPEEAAS